MAGVTLYRGIVLAFSSFTRDCGTHSWRGALWGDGIDYTARIHVIQLNTAIYDGFVGMFEVALLSMFLGGLSTIMQKEGGLDWLIQRIYSLTRLFKVGRERAGEIGLSFLVVFSNIFCGQ